MFVSVDLKNLRFNIFHKANLHLSIMKKKMHSLRHHKAIIGLRQSVYQCTSGYLIDAVD